jgi:hypothetical protein
MHHFLDNRSIANSAKKSVIYIFYRPCYRIVRFSHTIAILGAILTCSAVGAPNNTKPPYDLELNMTIQIVHIDGPEKGKTIEIEKDRILLGRDAHSDVKFPADLAIVSRKHAEIARQSQRIVFLCHGMNGCKVNGEQVGYAYLKSGDIIELAEGGPKMSFHCQTGCDKERQSPHSQAENNDKSLWDQFIDLVELATESPFAATDSPLEKSLAMLDEALAKQVKQHPGELEAHLLAGIDDLHSRRCVGPNNPPTLLEFVLAQPALESVGMRPVSTFARTLRALSHEGFIRFIVAARTIGSKAVLGDMAMQNSIGLAKWHLAHADGSLADKIPMAPELRDMLRDAPLPDILPPDVASLDTDDIATIIARYTGLPIEDTEDRIRSAGFLADNERLAQVIHRDAQTLARLGVDRHELADRLELLIDAFFFNESIDNWPTQEQIHRSPDYYSALWFKAHETQKQRLVAHLGEPTGPQGRFELPWKVTCLCWMGHQQDPFHSADIYSRTHRGACDVTVSYKDRPGVELRFGDMIVVLIRRAGFFEGSVPYRLDPEKAAWVLGLTDQPPPVSK